MKSEFQEDLPCLPGGSEHSGHAALAPLPAHHEAQRLQFEKGRLTNKLGFLKTKILLAFLYSNNVTVFSSTSKYFPNIK